MSNRFIRGNQTNVLPRINSNSDLTSKNYKNKKAFMNQNNNPLIIDKNFKIRPLEKKPGTSIDKKKPLYILPKIPIKKLSNTAGVKKNNLNNVGNFYQYNNYQNDNDNYNQIGLNTENYGEYENIGINLLDNDDELKKMFMEIYNKNDYESKKQWIDKNLFNREVFRVMLESYIKQNGDVNSFIRNEISKILNNKILDNMLLKSFKQIQFQYDEYINNIHNL